jgi:hypothetical protein
MPSHSGTLLAVISPRPLWQLPEYPSLPPSHSVQETYEAALLSKIAETRWKPLDLTRV